MSELTEMEQRLIGALERMRNAFSQQQGALQQAHARADAAEQERDAFAQSTPVGDVPAAPDADAEALKTELSVTLEALESAQAENERLAGELHDLRSAPAPMVEAPVVESTTADPVSRGEVEDLQARIGELELTLHKLKQVNGQLRQNNRALRDACEAGISDADLINDGLKQELAALEAARQADRAELESILSSLKPLVEDTQHA
ncbi:hypothetical protein [Qingshengfaniella alkalisoli]|uniref:Colicin transporter n=1 Tax=Qingshengfaniella alkalisoli TaxID=2599296 RepID=A0A5B8J368_9RHOB|nr:hypothetical protein [Qingshengfaniella alkalisoli]QDY68730.1 hypothetical protein FPZ52_03210 [Qingshengfaniella alkalisoli]